MKFRILSHAGLEIIAKNKCLVCDPWLIGSTYWRSWWNYPPVEDELVNSIKPDYIYLTHVHWDHFTGPSLRLFQKDTPILIPKEPSGRMFQDLEKMGFSRIIELNHGQSYELASGFVITSYQFYVFTDSALVAEADDIVLLNANDAKFMGGPLRHILKRHTNIKFVFRSHSSANSRIMYEFIDQPEVKYDEREHYIEDFAKFAEISGAQYAIPFASNHCHMHREVYEYNDYICTPLEVKQYFENKRISHPILKIMVSGDSWDSETGFEIKQQDYFENKEKHLSIYRDQVEGKLQVTYQKENKAKLVLEQVFNYFENFFNSIPWLMRRLLGSDPFLFVLTSGETRNLIEINFRHRSCREIRSYSDDSHPMQIITSIALFHHCIRADLFSHLAISKRIKYRTTKSKLKQLRTLAYCFNFYEYNLFPLSQIRVSRFIMQWSRRWRELLLYIQILTNIIIGKPFVYTEYLTRPKIYAPKL